MPARPYRASGLSHPGALARLGLMCLVAALAGGFVEGYISRYISLLLLFPMVLGLIVGATAIRVIARTHIRAPLLAAVVAGGAGLIAQATLIGSQYYQFRIAQRGEFAERAELAGMLDKVIDMAIEQETGQRGIVGYLMIRAKVGTQIQKAGSSSSGLTLQGPAFWILFAINFLIVAGVAAAMAAERARAPYCEACQRWYDRTDHLARGSTQKSDVSATLQAIERGAFNEVPRTLGGSTAQAASLLQMLRCSNCAGHEPQLTYTVVTGIGKKPNSKKVLTTLLRPEDAKILTGAFEKRS